ncbi:MAG: GDP-L-fucose synthase [Betaproteobacteria bacterium]|nr:GDP-L-fucose synthase [Betaproteobacteria bacterium]
MQPDSRIFVAGHLGLVGSALVRRLRAGGYANLILRPRSELDLTHQAAVEQFFAATRPEYVFMAAGRVGGIHANSTYPAEFIQQNLAMEVQVISACHRHGVKKLLFPGSSCIYPREAPQPIREEYLLTGVLEPTNEAYAIAKIAGIKMCSAHNRQYGTDYLCVQPTNLYGPGDEYDLQNSHVLPALIRKMHEAKLGGAAEVVVWGSGRPRREFLHSDDLADACVFLMERYSAAQVGELVNIGTGRDMPIAELAGLVAQVVGFRGRLVTDSSKPDGMPKKLLDVSRLTALGWRARIDLREGIASTYRAFLEEHPQVPNRA